MSVNEKEKDRLAELIELIVESRISDELFPKSCRSCGEEFKTLFDYVRRTKPKGHGFEDYSRIMGRHYTMWYRHCDCGNTLVVVFTKENFPQIEEFWSALRDLSEIRGSPLAGMVVDFSETFDHHITSTGGRNV